MPSKPVSPPLIASVLRIAGALLVFATAAVVVWAPELFIAVAACVPAAVLCFALARDRVANDAEHVMCPRCRQAIRFDE